MQNWEDVDCVMRRIGELDLELERINGDATMKMNEVKQAAKEAAGPVQKERKELAGEVEKFCASRKAEFANKRHKRLTYGEIGYRLVRSVPVPRAAEKVKSLLSALKSFGLCSCIEQTEKVNRDEICKLSDEELVKLGLTRTVKDSFRICPDTDALKEVEA